MKTKEKLREMILSILSKDKKQSPIKLWIILYDTIPFRNDKNFSLELIEEILKELTEEGIVEEKYDPEVVHGEGTTGAIRYFYKGENAPITDQEKVLSLLVFYINASRRHLDEAGVGEFENDSYDDITKFMRKYNLKGAFSGFLSDEKMEAGQAIIEGKEQTPVTTDPAKIRDFTEREKELSLLMGFYLSISHDYIVDKDEKTQIRWNIGEEKWNSFTKFIEKYGFTYEEMVKLTDTLREESTLRMKQHLASQKAKPESKKSSKYTSADFVRDFNRAEEIEYITPEHFEHAIQEYVGDSKDIKIAWHTARRKFQLIKDGKDIANHSENCGFCLTWKNKHGEFAGSNDECKDICLCWKMCLNNYTTPNYYSGEEWLEHMESIKPQIFGENFK